MANTTSTVAANVIEKRVSTLVQETLIQNSVMIPAIWDRSGEVGPGMDRLDIPLLTSLAAQTVSESGDLTASAPTISTDQMSLDQQKAVVWAITDRASIQSKININAEILKNAGKELAKDVDDKIITDMVAGVSTSAPDHLIAFSNASELSDGDVRNARELLNEQNVPMSERFMLVGSEAEKNLLAVSNFIEVQKYGNEARALQTGELGRLYGFTVLLSTSSALGAGEALFFHKQCHAYASQASMRFRSEEKALGHRIEYSLSILYGSQHLDSGKRIVHVNSSGT